MRRQLTQLSAQVIGGFDPSNVAGTNIAANWTDSLGNFSVSVNAGAFTSNGLKTVKIYTTDDAGSSGNSVTIQFTLAVSGISAPTPPITPTLAIGALRCYRCPWIHQHSHAQSHRGYDARCNC